MIRLLKFTFVLVMLSQCIQPKINGCEDVLFAKQKNEQYKKRLKHEPRADVKPESIAELLEFPLQNFTASSQVGEPDLSAYLSNKPDLLNLMSRRHNDTTINKTKEQQKLEEQIKKLKSEIKSQEKIFENPGQNANKIIPPSAHNKALRLAKISFFGFVLSPIIPFVGLLSLIAVIIVGFKSLKIYRDIINQKGKWMAQVGVYGGITILALLILLIIALFITWNNNGLE